MHSAAQMHVRCKLWSCRRGYTIGSDLRGGAIAACSALHPMDVMHALHALHHMEVSMHGRQESPDVNTVQLIACSMPWGAARSVMSHRCYLARKTQGTPASHRVTVTVP